MAPLLEVEDIHTFYGNIEALKGISLTVNEGEVVTLIGSNGAGKSTLMRALSGVVTVTGGRIELDGRPLQEMPPQRRVAEGLIHVPEGRRLFRSMKPRMW